MNENVFNRLFMIAVLFFLLTAVDTTSPTGADMKQLEKLHQLGATITNFGDGNRVELKGPRFDDSTMDLLSDVPDLLTVTLIETRVTKDGINKLSANAALRAVTARNVDNDVARALLSLRQLELLDIKSANLSGMELDQLSSHHALECLQLTGAKLAEGGAGKLGELKKLRSLDFDKSTLTDAGMQEIAKCETLEHLNLADTAVTDQGIAAIESLKSLRALMLKGVPITDKGLVAIPKLTELRYLDLEKTRVTNAGMAALGDLPNLDHLVLTNTQVDLKGLEQMKRIPGIVSLDPKLVSKADLLMFMFRRAHARKTPASVEFEKFGGGFVPDVEKVEVHVYFEGPRITDAQLPILEDVLAEYEGTHLSLRNSKISVAGLQTFLERLKKRGKVFPPDEVNVSGTIISRAEAAEIARKWKFNVRCDNTKE